MINYYHLFLSRIKDSPEKRYRLLLEEHPEMLARMKGFIDKLIFPGIAYGYTKNGMMRSSLNNLKKVTVITTMNTPGIIYKTIFGNAIRGSLMMGTFRKLGIRGAKWINLSRVKGAGRKKREKWLSDIQRRFATI